MLACSNVHVSGGFSIFDNAFSKTFGVSHRFVTPIKGCKATYSVRLEKIHFFSKSVKL